MMPEEQGNLLPISALPLAHLGAIADTVARQAILEQYQAEKSPETLRRQRNDVALFERYLQDAGHRVQGMADDLSAWHGVSFGLISGFREWLLREGRAIGSVHVIMATIKVYCKLAMQAGFIAEDAYTLIQTVRTPSGKFARNLDEKRAVKRIGRKKEHATMLSDAHVDLLKKMLCDRSIFARDSLLLCLLVDHGLRCGEIAALAVSDVDIAAGMMTFYRHKVDKTQVHQMTADTLQAMQRYMAICQPHTRLFEGSGGKIKKAEDGLTTRAINKIVGEWGVMLGVTEQRLSPHDLRHYWATRAARHGTDLNDLRQAGGWSSLVMPVRYIEETAIANKHVKL